MYDREFLIQFKDMKICMEKPRDLDVDLLRDTPFSRDGNYSRHGVGGGGSRGGGMYTKNEHRVNYIHRLSCSMMTDVCVCFLQQGRKGPEPKRILHQPAVEKVSAKKEKIFSLCFVFTH